MIDLAATPDLVARGAMVLQPSEERRRSGSHYTPRTLTEPVVRTTLRPILDRLRGTLGKAPRPEVILDLKVCDPAMGSGAFLVEACRQLAEALIEAWAVHGGRPPIPVDEDEIVFARRLVAQRCLYGVDRNPVAVDLAKVSLWLVTLAKDHALTFLDHALRHGDSLVGLSRLQIENFHWDTSITYDSPFRAKLREHVARVISLRQQIREAGEDVPDSDRRELWNDVQLELNNVRLFGDLVIATFFDAEKLKERERKRSEYINAIVRGEAERFRSWFDERRYADPPLAPFHWEIEFPEVFERAEPGFDSIIGNPPFLGGRNISGTTGKGYLNWLFDSTEGASGQTDLVAYFFRRSYDRLRKGGTLGLIATNTIAQGDTRRSSLTWICRGGGQIYCARRRVVWPGLAVVVVSVVHIGKEVMTEPCILNGRSTPKITAFLLSNGPSEDPLPLQASQGIAFKGPEPYGKGFQFADGEEDASPLSEMVRLVSLNPSNQRRIRPYLGGSEILVDPMHRHHRFIIDFGDLDEREAAEFPDLLEICRRKVLVERSTKDKEVADWPYWRYWRTRPALRAAIEGLTRTLAHPFTSTHLAFAFVPASTVVASPHVVIASESFAVFATLQSRVHELWARLTSSTLKDDLSYKVSDSFDTFPFAQSWSTLPLLETAGRHYYDFRDALMVRNEEGLTKTYNRFHDPNEQAPDILKLRELHGAMDRAVLDAYGWYDIPIDCEFLLDYEIDEEEWDEKKKKKPYRYRWPEDVRDGVIARLLELNAERARAEAMAGAASGRRRAGKRTVKPAAAHSDMKDLFS
ncbi:unannotated protein [freshwater metagenome]|uniref:site-specific DNA-methyltransferase (adenine-specific) n=1 Tax=freshwater metagenome TaxID=449393 RepID=A0A6J5ZYZ8_9ZZZZ